MSTTVLTAPTVSIIPQGGSGFPLDIVDNTFNVQFDEGQSPYFQAGVLTTRPDDTTYALLEPTKRTPVSVVVQVGATTPLTSTMYVYERQLDPETDRVALKLVTREMDLQTYSPVTTVNLVAQQGSVAGLCRSVIQSATGQTSTVALLGGATDQTTTVYTEAHNLFPNPDIAVTTGFTGATSNTISRVQATGSQASYGWAVRSTASAAVSRIDVQWPQTASVAIPGTAGQQYTLSMAVRGSGTLTLTLYMQFNNSAGVTLQTMSKTLTGVTSVFGARQSISAVAPPSTSTITWVLRNSASNASGVVLDAAQIMLVEGNGVDLATGTALAYFSGATADTADYHYAWDGDANASQSTRTPFVDRPPETLLWAPGTSGYDFLKPVLDAVGLRLFLREDGQWCLANNGYSLPGQLTVQYGSNLYEGSELLSLGETDADGFPMNADAVILNYSWTDTVTGQQKTATDTATSTSYKRPYVVDIDGPYPGPGQATFLLARLQARKYQVEATTRPDWTARPGLTAFISLANRPAQTGYVRALEFDLSTAQMTVTTKALVTAVTGSYGKAPITQTYASVASTVTYANYTN